MAGLIGVILTLNPPTEIYPESVLTFQTTSPVTISAVNAPQAFRYVGPDEYDRPYMAQSAPPQQPVLVRRPAPYPAYPAPYAAYPPPYAPYPYPYYGPSVVVGVGGWWGPGYYGHGYYYGHGPYGHHH
jgi:hypothetical protein